MIKLGLPPFPSREGGEGEGRAGNTFLCSSMMMLALKTINSGLVPLIEGLCAQICYFRFEIIGGLNIENYTLPPVLGGK